jgi:hypothetical protein
MKIWWILGILLLVLLVLRFRESFTNYDEVLRSLGQSSGYTSLEPKCPEGSALNSAKTMCKFTDPSKADVVPTCSSDTLEFVGGTCRPKAVGATTGETTARTTGGATGGSERVATAVSARASSSPSMRITQEEAPEEYADPICPTGTSLDSTKRCRYPGEAEMPTCPSGYAMTGGAMCRKIGGMEEIEPMCPVGKILDRNNGEPGWGCIKQHATSTCPSGFSLRVGETGNTCFKHRGSSRPTATTTTTATANRTADGRTTAPALQTETGVTPATVRKNTVLGPSFTSYGSPLDGAGIDSSKTTQYPELLGGGDPAARNREASAGGGGFGFGIDLKGAMPSAGGLGSTEESKFFPFSRQPGDMDLIPDPYRVSQQFSSSSYSFKTEPTPFLTDFSAFFR